MSANFDEAWTSLPAGRMPVPPRRVHVACRRRLAVGSVLTESNGVIVAEGPIARTTLQAVATFSKARRSPMPR